MNELLTKDNKPPDIIAAQQYQLLTEENKEKVSRYVDLLIKDQCSHAL